MRRIYRQSVRYQILFFIAIYLQSERLDEIALLCDASNLANVILIFANFLIFKSTIINPYTILLVERKGERSF